MTPVTDIHQYRILILDFGSQYTQLLARRVREAGVYCEIMSAGVPEKKIHDFQPAGIILSGGPDSVTDQVTARAPEVVFQLGCPVLGICYGMQTMAAQLGGQVTSGKRREFGYARVTVTASSALLDGLQDADDPDGKPVLDVWMSHGDHVQTVPPGFIVTAATDNCPVVAMADNKKHFYGLQFHPEVSHTRQGKAIFSHFLFDVCGCQPVWTTGNIAETLIDTIRTQVRSEHVLLGLSGGVDSSVLAVLLSRAIGKQLTCVFVDTGLLRLNEAAEVQKLFADHLGINLVTVDAAEHFLQALAGVTDPEEKRRIIGRVFVEVFEREAEKNKEALWLAQGTIYPDVIESAGGSDKSQVIKSHHNVGGLPANMRLKLLEPLRELFKDEVRELGLALGLPRQVVFRHPFPGPGLAVRVAGEVRAERLKVLREADAILIDALRTHDFYDRVAQAFVVFLPVKSVGVLGDARYYSDVLAVRIVESVDFMTAHVADLPLSFLTHVADRIVNEVKGVSRVVYDISGKPPATIEWE